MYKSGLRRYLENLKSAGVVYQNFYTTKNLKYFQDIGIKLEK